MEPMPVTVFFVKCAVASLLLGFVLGAFTGWFGLFHVTVWSVVAIAPAFIIDWMLIFLGVRATRCPVK
jgi:hypothetical protein